MEVYNALGRMVSLLLTPFFWLQNRVLGYLRPRVVVLNEKQQILLVKNWVGRQRWELPGGAAKYGEDPVAAAQRELFEEVGMGVRKEQLEYLTTLLGRYEAPIFVVHVVDSVIMRRRGEIIACEWHDLAALPAELSPRAHLALTKMAKL